MSTGLDCGPRGVSQEGWQRETKVHRVLPVSRPMSQRPRALSGAISCVAISTLATAAAMSGGLAGRTRRLRPQVNDLGIGPVFQQLRAIIFGYSFLAYTRVEQKDREPNSDSSPVGPHANSQTDAELGRGQQSVSTGAGDRLLHWPNTPTASGDTARRGEFCWPGTVITNRDERERRRTVDLWAKQEHAAWSACQTHHRVQSWELDGRRESVLGCSVAQKGGHVVRETSLERNHRREILDLDRPSATCSNSRIGEVQVATTTRGLRRLA